MKKLILALLIMTAAIYAEEGKTKSITTSPIGVIFGNFNATYQMEFAPKHAIGIGGFFWKPWILDLKSYGASLSYNFYSKGGMEGFWVSPSVNFGAVSWSYETFDDDLNLVDTTETIFALGGGATVGYRWTWESGFTMGAAGGLQFTGGSYEGIDFGGVGPALVFDLGYAF